MKVQFAEGETRYGLKVQFAEGETGGAERTKPAEEKVEASASTIVAEDGGVDSSGPGGEPRTPLRGTAPAPTPASAPAPAVVGYSPKVDILGMYSYCGCRFQIYTFGPAEVHDGRFTVGKTPDRTNTVKLRSSVDGRRYYEGEHHPRIKIISVPRGSGLEGLEGASIDEDMTIAGKSWVEVLAILLLHSHALYHRSGNDFAGYKRVGHVDPGHQFYAMNQVGIIESCYALLRASHDDILDVDFEIRMATYFGDPSDYRAFYLAIDLHRKVGPPTVDELKDVSPLFQAITKNITDAVRTIVTERRERRVAAARMRPAEEGIMEGGRPARLLFDKPPRSILMPRVVTMRMRARRDDALEEDKGAGVGERDSIVRKRARGEGLQDIALEVRVRMYGDVVVSGEATREGFTFTAHQRMALSPTKEVEEGEPLAGVAKRSRNKLS